MKEVRCQTDRIEVDAEKLRKDAGTMFIKADSAFKKARLLE